jgi:hypothetical protein
LSVSLLHAMKNENVRAFCICHDPGICSQSVSKKQGL